MGDTRHCEERGDEAIQFCLCLALDCFASLAMTALFSQRYFVSGQPLSFAVKNALSPGTTAISL